LLFAIRERYAFRSACRIADRQTVCPWDVRGVFGLGDLVFPS
jgi:hypothetical protein